MNSTDMETVVKFIDAAFKLAVQIQEVSGPNQKDFENACCEPGWKSQINSLKANVRAFAKTFRLPVEPIL